VRRSKLDKKIVIVKGIGEGSTSLSAFDAALSNAGIGDFNLLELSSVIPKQTLIEIKNKFDLDYEVGQIQPVVLSHTESDETGKEISAGLGWTIAEEGGVFIEISGCFGEKSCVEKIESSLKDMIARRSWKWDGKINKYIATTTVGKKFSSVTVCAVYTFSKL